MNIVEEEFVIPTKRKPDDAIAFLLAQSNTENANQFRVLKAELKKSVKSTR